MPGRLRTGENDAMTVSRTFRLWQAVQLIAGLRRHDLRAARTFIDTAFPTAGLVARWAQFARWVARHTFGVIPDALAGVTFDRCMSRVPVWLAEDNPLANHPWRTLPGAVLPEEAEVVVVGAGFTGASCAYHWSKHAAQRMLVLEMNDPAGGASGSCEGLVVMGRYFALVKRTVCRHLEQVRPDLAPAARDRLASQFAAAYARSAYKNADLIEETIRAEGYQCGYVRNGWIQVQDAADQTTLEESVRLGQAAGFGDWTKLEPDEALAAGGMRLDCPAGFSKRAAHFHPARWVWSLLGTALKAPTVDLFTRTRVLDVVDVGDRYLVNTTRGAVQARFVVNATESYTGLLHRRYCDLVYPVQTQAAFADGGPRTMRPGLGCSCSRGFFGRLTHPDGVIFGSDATRLPHTDAGANRPSRFLTKYVISEMNRYFGPSMLQVTREWSATAGFTADEFPVVGLLDGKRQYLIGGMCGSGTGVSFNAARHVVQRILGLPGPDDYPAEYFAPSRLLDPQRHPWPAVG